MRAIRRGERAEGGEGEGRALNEAVGKYHTFVKRLCLEEYGYGGWLVGGVRVVHLACRGQKLIVKINRENK